MPDLEALFILGRHCVFHIESMFFGSSFSTITTFPKKYVPHLGQRTTNSLKCFTWEVGINKELTGIERVFPNLSLCPNISLNCYAEVHAWK